MGFNGGLPPPPRPKHGTFPQRKLGLEKKTKVKGVPRRATACDLFKGNCPPNKKLTKKLYKTWGKKGKIQVAEVRDDAAKHFF